MLTEQSILQPNTQDQIPCVELLYDYIAQTNSELSLKAGEKVFVTQEQNGWSFGSTEDNRKGYMNIDLSYASMLDGFQLLTEEEFIYNNKIHTK